MPKPCCQKHAHGRRRVWSSTRHFEIESKCWNPSCSYLDRCCLKRSKFPQKRRPPLAQRTDLRLSLLASKPPKSRKGLRIQPAAAENFPAVKPRRYRNRDHLKFISSQHCALCGRQPCEAHHLRYAQPRALGRRVSDEFTVPLCRVHHRELHHEGNERSWWNKVNIDPEPIALRFWQQTRGVLVAGNDQKLEGLAAHQGGATESIPHVIARDD
jgi:hypothetical protein